MKCLNKGDRYREVSLYVPRFFLRQQNKVAYQSTIIDVINARGIYQDHMVEEKWAGIYFGSDKLAKIVNPFTTMLLKSLLSIVSFKSDWKPSNGSV